jgi:hypothetical protein
MVPTAPPEADHHGPPGRRHPALIHVPKMRVTGVRPTLDPSGESVRRPPPGPWRRPAKPATGGAERAVLAREAEKVVGSVWRKAFVQACQLEPRSRVRAGPDAPIHRRGRRPRFLARPHAVAVSLANQPAAAHLKVPAPVSVPESGDHRWWGASRYSLLGVFRLTLKSP